MLNRNPHLADQLQSSTLPCQAALRQAGLPTSLMPAIRCTICVHGRGAGAARPPSSCRSAGAAHAAVAAVFFLQGAAWTLTNNPANKAAISAADRILAVVRLLGSGCVCVQEVAAGALVKLAANNSAKQAAIAAGGGILLLVWLLGSSSDGVQEGAARALGNMAANDDANPAAIAAAGAIPPLGATAGQRQRGCAAPRSQGAVVFGCLQRCQSCSRRSRWAIPSLVRLLGSGSEHVQEGAAGALVYVAADTRGNNAAIEGVQQRAAAVLGHLAVKKHANQAAIAAAGAIPALERLLAIPRRASHDTQLSPGWSASV